MKCVTSRALTVNAVLLLHTSRRRVWVFLLFTQERERCASPAASVRFNTERRSQHEASYLHHLDTFGFAHLRDSLTGSGSDLWLVHMKSS